MHNLLTPVLPSPFLPLALPPNHQLMADMGMSLRMYGVVGGLPSLSSIFASLVGGAVVDSIGADRGCLLFAAVVLMGSACGAVGVSIRYVLPLFMSKVNYLYKTPWIDLYSFLLPSVPIFLPQLPPPPHVWPTPPRARRETPRLGPASLHPPRRRPRQSRFLLLGCLFCVSCCFVW